MKKKPLIIIGAGGHGRVVADIAALNGYEHISFLDDAAIPGMHIVGTVSQFQMFLASHEFIVAIGNNAARKRIFEMLCDAGATIVSLCHPKAVFGRNVKLGQGVTVMAGAVINNGAAIGDGTILNTCCSVDHDCQIGAFSHISVGTHLAGSVSVGESCVIGAGATVINNIEICSNCVVGAGAVVVRNLKEQGTYIGVPARIVEK